jgi:hypothetical protein
MCRPCNANDPITLSEGTKVDMAAVALAFFLSRPRGKRLTVTHSNPANADSIQGGASLRYLRYS